MKIFGVIKEDRYIGQTYEEIRNRTKKTDSFMDELPRNWNLIPSYFSKNFFDQLSERYNCNFNHGGMELKIYELFEEYQIPFDEPLDKSTYYDEHKKSLLDTIRGINPDVVIASIKNASHMKRKFPDSYYAVFTPKRSKLLDVANNLFCKLKGFKSDSVLMTDDGVIEVDEFIYLKKSKPI